MTITKGVLLAAAAVFVGLGAWFLAQPERAAALVEIGLPTAMARTDFRAGYGGFSVGVGLFLGMCAMRSGWLRPGAAAMGLASGGFAGGRLVGIMFEGTASNSMLAFLALEISGALLAFYLLRRLNREGSLE